MDTRWLGRARSLGNRAPAWARRLYSRSLLILHALTDPRTGAVSAGARDGWAYVWPRDAATAALALRAAGFGHEARRVSRFLSRIDIGAAARFHADGSPVSGRGPQGDAAGWVAAAAAATGTRGDPAHPVEKNPSWEGVADYREGGTGDFLGNAIATAGHDLAHHRGSQRAPMVEERFATPRGLVRSAGEPASGLDSAAAWAVRPFGLRRLFPQARETMLGLTRAGGRFGITLGGGWPDSDPWTAPTAWTAWSLAALARIEGGRRGRVDRKQALRLLGDLRRDATSVGTLPERVDRRTGIATSTTPLAWSHAFAVLALLQLWPPGRP